MTFEIIVIAITILVLDFIWLHGFLLKFFEKMINNVQKEVMTVRPAGALIAYIALIFLAVVFLPKTNNLTEAFLLGFSIYAVYDGTNYATLNNWDSKIAIIDSLWGGVLFVLVKLISRKIS